MAIRIVVLISGGGTTLLNLLNRFNDGCLSAEIARVISNSSDAKGLIFAEEYGIPSTVIDSKLEPDLTEFSESIFETCRRSLADLVVMGGFLRRVLIPPDFENRVVNIHPSLIPAFCGQGMYGLKVHQAVLDYGCKLTGCTVHFVDNEYDHGPIIAQQAVQVEADDSPQSLADRVFAAECELYPAVINAIAGGQIRVQGRMVHYPS
jgi:phosphoribosylglycinamide formyltransferase-1